MKYSIFSPLVVAGLVALLLAGTSFAKQDDDTPGSSVAADIAVLKTRVTALETQNAYLLNLLQHFSLSGNDVTITGANLHVVNGTGTTDSVNGLGNVIVGYNEPRSTTSDRSGSHMLVVGRGNDFSSYGGLVVGRFNTASGVHSVVCGGEWNIASDIYATTVGGGRNVASGQVSCIAGGSNSSATAVRAAVFGGVANAATAVEASVLGGQLNVASGQAATISGGANNIASGLGAAIGGGNGNLASGDSASISGGQECVASGPLASVSGGVFNTASARWATVGGGKSCTAGAVGSSVSGGLQRSIPHVDGAQNVFLWVAGGLLAPQ